MLKQTMNGVSNHAMQYSLCKEYVDMGLKQRDSNFNSDTTFQNLNRKFSSHMECPTHIRSFKDLSSKFHVKRTNQF